MKIVAVTQRVEVDDETLERRDALDQRWTLFLGECGLSPLLLPNHIPAARELLENGGVHGILLTGGGDLEVCGGSSPERDQTENFLIEFSIRRKIPLLGVCRGMQAIQHYFGVPLERVSGHVAPAQEIRVRGAVKAVNSFHQWGAKITREPLEIWAQAPDGVVKAVRHRELPIQGIMWHPERFEPSRGDDIEWVRDSFAGLKAAV